MLRKRRRDKGHQVEAAAFLRTAQANEALPAEWLLPSVHANARFHSARTKRGGEG